MGKIRIMITGFLILCVLIVGVYAAGEIIQDADRLNYYSQENHTVIVSNSAAYLVNFTIPIPSGWTFISGTSGCGLVAGEVECNVSAASTATYTVQSPGSAVPEYTTSVFEAANFTGTNSSNKNVTFLRIKNSEIFHTLVEFGRGRGNYFFDSGYTNLSGSGHTGIGCPYVPNGTLFQLNYLHKVLNVKQYFGLATSSAYNATFTCTYPNSTIVRTHLATSISRSGSTTTTAYRISEIEGSWERMGYLGQDFDVGEFAVGNTIVINCTDITYTFPDAGGNMSIPVDDFILTMRDRYPFQVNATAYGTIYNGTSEIYVEYNITNNEQYSVTNIIAEIRAPQYGTFIGTRGELWGTSLEKFRIERIDMASGESEIIGLVVRFNTTDAGAITTLELSQGVDINYLTCWEAQAYNPQEYTQGIGTGGIESGTVDMTAITNIVPIQVRLELIFNLTIDINSTILQINSTVNSIQTIVNEINSTVVAINDTVNAIITTVNQINVTVNTIESIVQIINETINQVNSTVNLNNELLLNLTVDMANLTLTINAMNDTIIQINGTVNSIQSDISDLNLTINTINGTVNGINITVDYIKNTIWGNNTAQTLLDAINNISSDNVAVLTEISKLQEFDEELVFLVTDAFGLEQAAGRDVRNGDLGAAADKLREANARLTDAADRLGALQVQASQEQALEVGNNGWLLPVALVVLAIGLYLYLFAEVPQYRHGGPPPRRRARMRRR